MVPVPAELELEVMPSWTNALPCTAGITVKANLDNVRSQMFNDQGTNILSEEGGNIVVVSPTSIATSMVPRPSARPITNISKFTLANLDRVYSATI